MVLVFVAFWTLFLGGLVTKEARDALRAKTRAEWVLDAVGLLAQGLLVPLAQIAIVVALLHRLWPEARGSLHVPPALAFVLNFVGVDYLYYWNHRFLHRDALWRFHAVHHSITSMDVLGTARNVAWAPVLIVYVYVNGLFLYLLEDAAGAAFAASAAITAALDLWRHSRVAPSFGSLAHRALATALVTPHEHAAHHGRAEPHGNYGANLTLWDRLHGTYRSPRHAPGALGVPLEGSLAELLLFPKDRSR